MVKKPPPQKTDFIWCYLLSDDLSAETIEKYDQVLEATVPYILTSVMLPVAVHVKCSSFYFQSSRNDFCLIIHASTVRASLPSGAAWWRAVPNLFFKNSVREAVKERYAGKVDRKQVRMKRRRTATALNQVEWNLSVRTICSASGTSEKWWIKYAIILMNVWHSSSSQHRLFIFPSVTSLSFFSPPPIFKACVHIHLLRGRGGQGGSFGSWLKCFDVKMSLNGATSVIWMK